ncbi:MAG: hypothetical protein J7J38_01965 [Candidatus Aenigmarchaeota archaeon]|nr:hypothetical protein [Candidatus Aenigmarchaeota archaeon]
MKGYETVHYIAALVIGLIILLVAFALVKNVDISALSMTETGNKRTLCNLWIESGCGDWDPIYTVNLTAEDGPCEEISGTPEQKKAKLERCRELCGCPDVEE